MKLRKILAMTLAAVMTLSLGSMAVTAEETTEAAAEATVESPVAGKKGCLHHVHEPGHHL